MLIELNQDEIETIQIALECWEKDASTGALMTSILGAVLVPEKDRGMEEARREKAFQKAEQDGKLRKIKSLMIRAKLAQSLTALMVKST